MIIPIFQRRYPIVALEELAQRSLVGKVQLVCYFLKGEIRLQQQFVDFAVQEVADHLIHIASGQFLDDAA